MRSTDSTGPRKKEKRNELAANVNYVPRDTDTDRNTSFDSPDKSNVSLRNDVSLTSTAKKYKDQGHTLISGKWILGKKVGAGNFGELRIGHDVDNNSKVAVKLEEQASKNPQLAREYHFYQMLKEYSETPVEGFPDVLFYGQIAKYNALVMDLLGPSLDDLFELCEKNFSIHCVCTIGLQIVDRFQQMHNRGLIYRDVKPENFLIGRKSLNNFETIFIIDMGLAKIYRDPRTKIHMSERNNQAVTGTARYMSVSANLGREQSRRDDLEAVGHLLIYFIKAKLPWQGLKPTKEVKDHIKLIAKVKDETKLEELCNGLPLEFYEYMRYIRSLNFYDAPDYGFLQRLLIDAYDNSDKEHGFQYDWSKHDFSIFRQVSLISFPHAPVTLKDKRDKRDTKNLLELSRLEDIKKSQKPSKSPSSYSQKDTLKATSTTLNNTRASPEPDEVNPNVKNNIYYEENRYNSNRTSDERGCCACGKKRQTQPEMMFTSDSPNERGESKHSVGR